MSAPNAKPQALRRLEDGYQPPSAEEIAALMRQYRLSVNQVALMSCTDSRQVIQWCTPRRRRDGSLNPRHRTVPYAQWRMLLLELGIIHRL